MRYRGGCVLPRSFGTCFRPLRVSGRTGRVQYNVSIHRAYCSSKQSPQDKAVSTQDKAAAALKNLAELRKQWGQNSAEKTFMVARGMVREAQTSLEALQIRLKEEERRLRTAYENAEEGEREKFALFSAGVRESHEKERARAERTKNWSIFGSVLGAIIGVMGSTYVNLRPQLEQSVGKMATEIQVVKKSVVTRLVEKPVARTKDSQLLVCETKSIIQGLDQTEKRLEAQINKTTLYTTVLTYTAFALTMPVLYVIFKGT